MSGMELEREQSFIERSVDNIIRICVHGGIRGWIYFENKILGSLEESMLKIYQDIVPFLFRVKFSVNDIIVESRNR